MSVTPMSVTSSVILTGHALYWLSLRGVLEVRELKFPLLSPTDDDGYRMVTVTPVSRVCGWGVRDGVGGGSLLYPTGSLVQAGRRRRSGRSGHTRKIHVSSPSASPSSSHTHGYHRLDSLVWCGTEAEALAAGSPVERLTPPWKVMLLSDGSVTRHLQLLFGRDRGVVVDVVEMGEVGGGWEGEGPWTCPIPGIGGEGEGWGAVRRQVGVVSLLLCRCVVVSLCRRVVVCTHSLFLLLLFLGVFEGGGVVGGGSEVGAFCVCGVVVAEGCGG